MANKQTNNHDREQTTMISKKAKAVQVHAIKKQQSVL